MNPVTTLLKIVMLTPKGVIFRPKLYSYSKSSYFGFLLELPQLAIYLFLTVQRDKSHYVGVNNIQSIN